MSTIRASEPDRRNPNSLTRASFAVEEAKYGPISDDFGKVTPMDTAVVLRELLGDVAKDMDAGQITAELSWYAYNFHRQLIHWMRESGTEASPLSIIASVMVDGYMHGVAHARGLSAEPRGPMHGDPDRG